MQPVQPIFVVDLFPSLHAELLTLLESLTLDQWELPTIAAPWTVRDMVAHLLDTDIKRLSSQRDHVVRAPLDAPLEAFRNVVDFIDDQNALWVRAARRLSPRVLIDLHRLIGPQFHAHLRSLDPYALAPLSVMWAGEDESYNWFDIAREYTEKWHHQQHIRMAVGAPLLNDRRWLQPALDTFIRALPYTYRNVEARTDTVLVVHITGEAEDAWTLMREDLSQYGGEGEGWRLYHEYDTFYDGMVALPDDIAWRLFTKGISAEAARAEATFGGSPELGSHLFDLLAIMG